MSPLVSSESLSSLGSLTASAAQNVISTLLKHPEEARHLGHKACLTALKLAAAGSVYTEFSVSAYCKFIKGLAIAAEKKRRDTFEPQRGIFSARRWIPRYSLGSSTETLQKSVAIAKTLTSPSQFISEISTVIETKGQIESDVVKDSLVYKYLWSRLLASSA